MNLFRYISIEEANILHVQGMNKIVVQRRKKVLSKLFEQQSCREFVVLEAGRQWDHHPGVYSGSTPERSDIALGPTRW
jgi:hypothetical protein